MGILEHALGWAARGFRVFPILPGDKVPPKGLAWKDEATTDPSKLRSWWAFEPRYNYGVAGGDGLLVVDVDKDKNGYASLLDVEVPGTLAVRTPGGGMHLYLAGPDVQNTVDRVAPGIDIRSAGGYVVGPGSVFLDPGGKKGYSGVYEVIADVPLAGAPESLILLAGLPKARDHGPIVSVDSPDDIVFAMHYLLKDAPVAVEGRGGNNTTYAVAARLIEMGVSAATAGELMLEHWNERCTPPWERDELLRIAVNAETYAVRPQGSGGIEAARADFADVVPLDDAPPAPSARGRFDAVFAQRKIIPLDAIPKRDWLMHRFLLRNEATVLTGPGGAGKSGFALLIAIHGAVGRAFMGYDVPRPFASLVYNLEDTREEMSARFHAACAQYQIDPDEAEKRVLLWPGREMQFKLFGDDRKVAMPDLKELARLLRENAFDVGIFDPLVKLHAEDENDNTAMGRVMDAANGLCRMAGIAGLFVHHAAKGSRGAGTADAARGAGNIVNSVRLAATLFPADEAEEKVYGLGEGASRRFVRFDDAKSNVSEMSVKPLWFEKQSFPLPCGDSTYSMAPFETSASAQGEAALMASILAEAMTLAGTVHLATHDAARVLANANEYFRERLPASGDLRQLRVQLEARLARPTEVDGGAVVSVESKIKPGADGSRLYVVLTRA